MDNDILNETNLDTSPDTVSEEIPETDIEPTVESEIESDVESHDVSSEETVPESSNDTAKAYLNSLIREERISNEYAEFKALFPDASVSELPDSVRISVKNGVPLAAAYALYERRKAMSASAASKVNEKNSELSFAVKSGKISETYFSPNEVRQMSASEVKANYSKIIDSMSHWN
jgi:hypothetical protein